MLFDMTQTFLFPVFWDVTLESPNKQGNSANMPPALRTGLG